MSIASRPRSAVRLSLQAKGGRGQWPGHQKRISTKWDRWQPRRATFESNAGPPTWRRTLGKAYKFKPNGGFGCFASTCSPWMFPSWFTDLERGEAKVPVRVGFHVHRQSFVACWYSWSEVRSKATEHALTFSVLLWSGGELRAKFDQNSYGCEMPERLFCDIGAQLSLLIEPSDLKIEDFWRTYFLVKDAQAWCV